jgi:hypothetical protein
MAAKLHLAENALALHLLLQRLKGLVDIVVADENLHTCSFCSRFMELVGGIALKLRHLDASCSRTTLESPHAEIFRAHHSGKTRVTCPILRPGRTAALP